ncbi:MAG TPA: hypothetical protein VH597_12640 [Verrucomicrobiae bacterium]|jgi:hypothetical protein|nr:hypothetical protein [Verrucomicrobiae bacterium]
MNAHQRILFATIFSFGIEIAIGGGQFVGQYSGGTTIDAMVTAEQVEQAKHAQELRTQEMIAAYNRHPWRIFNGGTNFVAGCDMVQFCGKVVEVQPEGIRIMGDFGESPHYYGSDAYHDDNREFFVKNFPFSVAENEVISIQEHFLGRYIGTYSYTAVSGGSRTIRAIDYGTPCLPPPEWVSKYNEAVSKANAAAKARSQLAQFIAQSNAVIWLAPEATNGSVSAQYGLALHYLKGQGCETNRDLAIYWLKKCSQQGNEDAVAKLNSLIYSHDPKSTNNVYPAN